jgi:cell cycle checkpoint protein
MDSNHPPIFTAVSSDARQLFLLLRCIGFLPKAEAQITSDGLRFSVEESRAVQGLTFLEKTLFSSYNFSPAALSHDSSSPEEISSTPAFQINLHALLETLQIFGLSDATASSSRKSNGGFTSSYATNAFNPSALALTGGTCRISYPYLGAPLSITISEAGVTTTCDLNTYEPSGGSNFDVDESIPLQRDALTLKIIMKSTWLFDAITELASTNPTVLILTASNHTPPLFALEGFGGPFGDSMVDFQPPHSSRNRNPTPSTTSPVDKKKAPIVSETFTVLPAPGMHGRVKQRYKFEHIQKAARAMGLASKVCIRSDRQGVLSLQFMVELGSETRGVALGRNGAIGNADGPNGAGSGKVSFVDFRFVPLIEEDDESDFEGEEDQDVDGESTGSPE